MDTYQLENVTSQVIQRVNNLNLEINNKTTKEVDIKEKELKILNDLYTAIRKYNQFLKEHPIKK